MTAPKQITPAMTETVSVDGVEVTGCRIGALTPLMRERLAEISLTRAIAAWLRQLTPEQFGWEFFGDLDEEMLGILADKIIAGDHLNQKGSGA